MQYFIIKNSKNIQVTIIDFMCICLDLSDCTNQNCVDYVHCSILLYEESAQKPGLQ